MAILAMAMDRLDWKFVKFPCTGEVISYTPVRTLKKQKKKKKKKSCSVKTHKPDCISIHMHSMVQIQRQICVFGQTADTYHPNTSLCAELDTWFLNTWPCQWLCVLEWRGAGATPHRNSSVALGERRTGRPIQASFFPHAVTPTGENPQLRNRKGILWPSTPVSENINRERQGRREEFADFSTSQAMSVPAASLRSSGRAAATARAVGAREAMPAPGLPSGSLGGGGGCCCAPPMVKSFPRSVQAAAATGEFLLQRWGQGVKGTGCFCKHG